MQKIAVDDQQLAAFAAHLQAAASVPPFDFCTRSEGFIYPERSRPGVLETFFFACAHQFGFWTLAGDRWEKPMVARLDGRDLKGSDFLFRACTRAWQRDPAAWQPAALAAMPDAALAARFQADDGTNPLPMWPEHLALIRGYCGWFAANHLEPAGALRRAAAAPKPLHALLEILAQVPGYAGDPLRKKAMLLAIVLENRPERFLAVSDPESAVPIIDYHLQRSALRTGLVRIGDPALRAKLAARTLLSEVEEDLIRTATYEAIKRLMQRTGLSAAAIDWFFFQNRTRCPETTEPDCPACPVYALCARETGLFQPVFRTTAY